MRASVPAISIRQPWAELILLGVKSIELRSWSTEYRGRLWLHTGRKGNPALEEEYNLPNLFKGGYIGSVVLAAIVPMDRDRWESWRDKHLDPGSYRAGTYAWVFSAPRRLQKPIPGPGQLNLFSPGNAVEAELREAELR